MNELAHQPGANGRLRELALFAGAGGGILGGHLLGWRTVCAVEWDAYAIAVLCARQNEGVLPPFPIWDDVRSFNGRPWRGRVDVISGGFPCQDISSAGKGAGITGARSGLWREMARIVGEVRPRFVFVENSPNLVGRGLAVVLGDLASLGYDARWCVLGADDAGAPHRRKRIWIVADSGGLRHGGQEHEVRAGRDAAVDGGEALADANGAGQPAVGGTWGSCGSPEAGNNAGRCGADMADAESLCSRPRLRQDGPQRDRDQLADGGADVPDADSGLRDGRADEQERGQEGRTAAGGAGEDVPDAASERGRRGDAEGEYAEDAGELRGSAGQDRGGVVGWFTEPAVRGVADGLAAELDQHGAAAAGYMGRVATGVQARADQLKCLGNGQVPLCAAMAWKILTEEMEDRA